METINGALTKLELKQSERADQDSKDDAIEHKFHNIFCFHGELVSEKLKQSVGTMFHVMSQGMSVKFGHD